MTQLSESQLGKMGQEFIAAFNLRRDPDHDDRYLTDYGSKTVLGVGRIAVRILGNNVGCDEHNI